MNVDDDSEGTQKVTRGGVVYAGMAGVIVRGERGFKKWLISVAVTDPWSKKHTHA